MKLLPAILLLILCPADTQDVRVATYSTGKPETAEYEGLSFWIKDDHRAYVRYTHGRDQDDIDLTYADHFSLKGRKGFKVQFPAGNRYFLIYPQDSTILVEDTIHHYHKTYAWENENQGGDLVSKCAICVQDERDAKKLLVDYFLK